MSGKSNRNSAKKPKSIAIPEAMMKSIQEAQIAAQKAAAPHHQRISNLLEGLLMSKGISMNGQKIKMSPDGKKLIITEG